MFGKDGKRLKWIANGWRMADGECRMANGEWNRKHQDFSHSNWHKCIFHSKKAKKSSTKYKSISFCVDRRRIPFNTEYSLWRTTQKKEEIYSLLMVSNGRCYHHHHRHRNTNLKYSWFLNDFWFLFFPDILLFVCLDFLLCCGWVVGFVNLFFFLSDIHSVFGCWFFCWLTVCLDYAFCENVFHSFPSHKGCTKAKITFHSQFTNYPSHP